MKPEPYPPKWRAELGTNGPTNAFTAQPSVTLMNDPLSANGFIETIFY